ncbi:CII family transcriptional regulator [Alicycliphilus denitrificans]|uniref:CII family transcriptional regulator n=1 Tax=Alicycliphilus denitrificans TaxID=179636 RepID=UPI000C9FB41C|nr:CII family transcriptional regulator [Alicycliphilus denitrificans]
MPEVSQDLRERARKTETALRNQLAEIGQSKLASSLGTSESTISRWKSEQIEQVALLLTGLGLKVVPEDAHLINADEVKAMRTLAMRGLRSMEGGQ